jgi:transcription initiation factor TFIIF subunit alpha
LPPGGQEFPLFVTKKSLKEGLRFHIMRFAPQIRGVKQAEIDPTNQEHFPRPVTLQRRDPRQPPPGREVKEEPVEPPLANAEETERLAQFKAQREAQRALDDAQKAPVLKDAERKRQQQKNKDDKKTATQIHYQPRTEKQKKEAEIRYEEALPWHMEDADGKHVWVGQYEAPLSNLKVALVPYPENGGYRMLPLEKWYKFAPKRGAFQHLTIEDAEKIMGKKAAPTRWAIRDSERNKVAIAKEESRRIMYGPTAVKQESSTFQQASRREKMEHDDIDMSGDEFQDDDETAGVEPERDEEAKDSKDRVRREMLGANLFGDADEKEVEKEETELQKEEEARKLLGKDLKKALRKRDKQFQYDSDSSSRDPFASSSVSHDLYLIFF